MKISSSPSIFSRVVLIIGGLAVIGLTYWFIRTSLMPISALPRVVANRATVKFDPALDVSKNEAFYRLQILLPVEPLAPPPGRLNPFIPVPLPKPLTEATSSLPEVSATAAAILLNQR